VKASAPSFPGRKRIDWLTWRAEMPSSRTLLVAALLAAAIPTAVAVAEDDEPTLTPQTKQAAELQAKADEHLKAKRHDEAIATYKKLLEHIEAHKGDFPDFPESQQKAVRSHAHYNTACAFALSGKRDAALDALKQAIDAGFYDWQWLEKDEDLASVRGEPRWKELVMSLRGLDKEAKRIEKLVKETVKEKPLFDFDFAVTTIDSEKIKLADYKGKVVVLVAFGTWNHRCKEFAPALVQLAHGAKERGEPVQVVVLDWERTDPTDAIETDVKDFIRDLKIGFPVALMKEKDPTLDRIPELKAFPTILWIDKAGKVRARWDDEKVLSLEELDAVTKAVLHDEKPKKADEKAPEKKKPDDKKKPEKKEDEPF
jgi:tetratricopeptide (TPR) repeat protein